MPGDRSRDTPMTKLARHAGRRKSRLQAIARQRLYPEPCDTLASLFAATANALGRIWMRGKAEGYQLLEEFVGAEVPAIVDRRPSPPGRPPFVPNRARVHPCSPEFLDSYEWRSLRMRVLVRLGARCQCCGHTAKDGVKLHIDHIKPRRTHPELALDESNLQVLCEVCNHGKGNWDETDWR